MAIDNRIGETIKAIEDARARHHKLSQDGRAKESAAVAAEMKAAGKLLVKLITEGADPCPRCAAPPHGMRQPNGRGGFEYEVGCTTCQPFKHVDGTIREFRVRGGLLPRHAVEAWNAGPDYWKIK